MTIFVLTALAAGPRAPFVRVAPSLSSPRRNKSVCSVENDLESDSVESLFSLSASAECCGAYFLDGSYGSLASDLFGGDRPMNQYSARRCGSCRSSAGGSHSARM